MNRPELTGYRFDPDSSAVDPRYAYTVSNAAMEVVLPKRVDPLPRRYRTEALRILGWKPVFAEAPVRARLFADGSMYVKCRKCMWAYSFVRGELPHDEAVRHLDRGCEGFGDRAVYGVPNALQQPIYRRGTTMKWGHAERTTDGMPIPETSKSRQDRRESQRDQRIKDAQEKDK